ncbi:MAG TPA: FmdB family zinc ribbon protein [Burkholderiaceae bacterium]|nr:FmdB family zinc ribbon protein [Burkholderiaceae bacterium]
MPIYAYRCSSCGHGADVMQKLSDPPLTVCTACGQPTFAKQITAAGFQLKGSGWYATDFKNGSKGAKREPASGEKPAETVVETRATESNSEKKSDATEKKLEPDSTKPAAQAGGRGGSPAC